MLCLPSLSWVDKNCKSTDNEDDIDDLFEAGATGTSLDTCQALSDYILDNIEDITSQDAVSPYLKDHLASKINSNFRPPINKGKLTNKEKDYRLKTSFEFL